MPHYKLALLGFGNVGRALARLLLDKRLELRERYDLTFSVTGIATGRHGSALDPQGIDLERAISISEASTTLESLSNPDDRSGQPAPGDAYDFIRRCGADVLFENTPVDYASGQPAIDHLRLALEMGMHAVTANKGPVVHAYRELTEFARQQGLKFYFESTVMDGAPIFALYRETLPGLRLMAFRGILNSTTNLLLTRMEAGETFEEAVRYAQQIGIAETDPSGDIDGWDAAVKVAALSTVLLGEPLKPQQVDRQGIRHIDREAVQQAKSEGKRWKLVCSAQRGEQGLKARVAPELVGAESPLYNVMGTTSIVQFQSDALGLLSLIEEDPGPHTTAYGLFADFLNAVRK